MYIAFIRPIHTYGALAWWKVIDTKSHISIPGKVLTVFGAFFRNIYANCAIRFKNRKAAILRGMGQLDLDSWDRLVIAKVKLR